MLGNEFCQLSTNPLNLCTGSAYTHGLHTHTSQGFPYMLPSPNRFKDVCLSDKVFQVNYQVHSQRHWYSLFMHAVQFWNIPVMCLFTQCLSQVGVKCPAGAIISCSLNTVKVIIKTKKVERGWKYVQFAAARGNVGYFLNTTVSQSEINSPVSPPVRFPNIIKKIQQNKQKTVEFCSHSVHFYAKQATN